MITNEPIARRSASSAAVATPQPSALRLRPLGPADEAEFLTAHQLMAADGFTFGLGYETDMAWADYLRLLADHRAGRNLQGRRVPATFLVADVGGTMVGRTSIRHRLNDFLLHEGGHIGYGVLPQHRRRGYATEILRQSLIILRSIGVDRVLVTCDDDNVGSRTVIETCGGQMENRARNEHGTLIRRYWID